MTYLTLICLSARSKASSYSLSFSLASLRLTLIDFTGAGVYRGLPELLQSIRGSYWEREDSTDKFQGQREEEKGLRRRFKEKTFDTVATIFLTSMSFLGLFRNR